VIAFKVFQIFLLPSCFIFILLILGLVLLKCEAFKVLPSEASRFLNAKHSRFCRALARQVLISKKRVGKILIILGIVFYYFFSITPIADLIISPLENQYKFSAPALDNVENIVLLIGGVKKGDLPISSKLEESSLFRAIKAVEIYFELTHKPNIIISGSDPLFPSNRPAKDIAKFIQNLNIPEENIILEEKSKNTYQSAKEVKKIIGQSPFVLVTSAYHLPRSVYIFRKMGLDPIPLPADFKAEENYHILDFFPDPQNLRKCDLAFHEYFGILYYKVLPR